MEQEIKTVKIRNGEDFTIINESDFDADKHELFEPTEAELETDDGDSDPDTIPDDFPGAKALAEAGITTLAQLVPHLENLTAIKGIGTATANAILAELETE